MSLSDCIKTVVIKNICDYCYLIRNDDKNSTKYTKIIDLLE